MHEMHVEHLLVPDTCSFQQVHACLQSDVAACLKKGKDCKSIKQ